VLLYQLIVSIQIMQMLQVRYQIKEEELGGRDIS